MLGVGCNVEGAVSMAAGDDLLICCRTCKINGGADNGCRNNNFFRFSKKISIIAGNLNFHVDIVFIPIFGKLIQLHVHIIQWLGSHNPIVSRWTTTLPKLFSECFHVLFNLLPEVLVSFIQAWGHRLAEKIYLAPHTYSGYANNGTGLS